MNNEPLASKKPEILKVRNVRPNKRRTEPEKINNSREIQRKEKEIKDSFRKEKREAEIVPNSNKVYLYGKSPYRPRRARAAPILEGGIPQ
jgi:hypothetical protein